MKKYPEKMAAYVEKHAADGSIEQMRQRVNKKFGTELSYSQMKSYYSNHKLHAAPRKGRKGYSKYPDGMEAYVRRIAEGKTTKELVDAVNKKYGEGTINIRLMKAYKKNHKINTGLTGHFEKGHVPWTKGKTWDEYMSKTSQENSLKTCYKKGHMPFNGGTPIGEIRERKARKNRPGSHPYLWQKVAQPNKWRMRHVIVWEEHNGPVPDGYMVTFADGNTLNCDIENLVLTSRAQHAVKNRHGIHGYDKESEITANRIADIKMAVTSAKKRAKKMRKAV